MKSAIAVTLMLLPLLSWAEVNPGSGQNERSDTRANPHSRVLTQADIRRFGDHTVSSLMARLAGIHSVPSGTAISGGALTVRARDLKDTVVLLDGVRLGRATDGLTELDTLAVSQIQRIEWTPGASAQYPAANGVIAIHTITTESGNDDLSFNSTLGSNSSQSHAIQFRVQAGSSHAQGGIHFQNSDGYDRTSLSANGNDDEDGLQQWAANISVTQQWSDNWQWQLNHSQAQRLADVDSADCTQNCAELQDETALMTSSLDYIFSAQNGWQYRGQLSRQLDELTRHPDDESQTERLAASWSAQSQDSANAQLQYGIDAYQEHIDSTADFVETERSNLGAFTQLGFEMREYRVDAGARLDGNSEFDPQLTGQATISSYLFGNLSASLGYHTAYRAPTLAEAANAQAPASGLEPEYSETFELGLQQTEGAFSWQLSLFQTDYQKLIDYDPDSSTPAVNRGRASVQGVELQWHARHPLVDLDFSGSYLEATNGNQQPLDSVTGWSASSTFTRHFGSLDWLVDLQLEQERRDAGHRLDDYTLIGTGLDLYFGGNELSRLYARIDNLFDESYRVRSSDDNSYRYPAAGRSYRLGIEYHL